ncbi:hypothetical protein JOB18_035416 [Solea senegalensis]|uniref:Uncharacterized protein n=1 Tax=Solea senegalensis TaxID=28829 RepID=A0AAV6QRI2_SOLSE|nr:hypothetical protein JOB18_035416 [Solea senegalensis]
MSSPLSGYSVVTCVSNEPALLNKEGMQGFVFITQQRGGISGSSSSSHVYHLTSDAPFEHMEVSAIVWYAKKHTAQVVAREKEHILHCPCGGSHLCLEREICIYTPLHEHDGSLFDCRWGKEAVLPQQELKIALNKQVLVEGL